MNDTNYKITVLVTFYNQEKYVDKALKSIFSQETNFDFKVVVGDDGSSDNTITKLQNWKNKFPNRLEYIIQKRDETKFYMCGARPSINRLSLLDYINTPYFIYLDGDDYWSNNKKLQEQFDVLEKEENQDCVACAHRVIVEYENQDLPNRYFPNKNFHYNKQIPLKDYWLFYYFHTDSILFRSKYIKNLNINLLTNFFNDNVITFAFMKFGKMIFLDKDYSVYLQTDKGIWVAAKKNVSVIRGLLHYDVELQLNPKLRKITILRHLDDFIYALQNAEQFQNLDSGYFDIAFQYNCMHTVRFLKTGCIFSFNKKIDYIYICLLKFKKRVYMKLKSFKYR